MLCTMLKNHVDELVAQKLTKYFTRIFKSPEHVFFWSSMHCLTAIYDLSFDSS